MISLFLRLCWSRLMSLSLSSLSSPDAIPHQSLSHVVTRSGQGFSLLLTSFFSLLSAAHFTVTMTKARPGRRSSRANSKCAGIRSIVSNLISSDRSSSAPTPITMIDSDSEGDDATLQQSSQQSSVTSASFTPPASSHSGKMTAAIRKIRDQLAEATAAAVSAAQVDVDLDSSMTEMQCGIESFFSRATSSPIMIDDDRDSECRVHRRTMSDITNVVCASSSSRQSTQRKSNERRRALYHQMRARFAHPDDNSKCRECGKREHTSLHHEADFRRAGTNIPAPSAMGINRLAGEVKRCTRKDGSIGLVSLCCTCHRSEELQIRWVPNSTMTSRGRLL